MTIEPLPNPLDLIEAWEDVAPALRDVEIRAAIALAALDRDRAWSEVGCSSIGHFGERYGIAAERARVLAGAGRALLELPHLEARLRGGHLSLEAAAVVGSVVCRPELLEEDDDWVEWAERVPLKVLRRQVRRREEEARTGGAPVVPVQVFVREDARDDFARAREIASAKAARALTEGETFETVVDHYLDTFDPDRVPAGTRRVPDTAMVNGRYVPMAVRRELDARQGHRCAVPYCDHTIFLEKAHIVAHARGGDREADNLLLLCSWHHEELDAGWISMTGTATKPVFLDPQGRDLARRFTLGFHAPSGSASRAPPEPSAVDPFDRPCQGPASEDVGPRVRPSEDRASADRPTENRVSENQVSEDRASPDSTAADARDSRALKERGADPPEPRPT